jgi:hypothetical protein
MAASRSAAVLVHKFKSEGGMCTHRLCNCCETSKACATPPLFQKHVISQLREVVFKLACLTYAAATFNGVYIGYTSSAGGLIISEARSLVLELCCSLSYCLCIWGWK